MPQGMPCSDMPMQTTMAKKENIAGARSIWYTLTPPALSAMSSRSVLMRKKVRNTLIMHEMGSTMIRKRGIM